MRLVTLFTAILFSSAPVSASQCDNEKHWSALNSNHQSLASQFRELIHEIRDDKIKTNPVSFLHRRFSSEQYADLWDLTKPQEQARLSDTMNSYKTNLNNLDGYIRKLDAVIRQGKNLERQAHRLMQDCRNNQESYTRARSNYQLALGSLENYTKQQNALRRAVPMYHQDVRFLQQALLQAVGKHNN